MKVFKSNSSPVQESKKATLYHFPPLLHHAFSNHERAPGCERRYAGESTETCAILTDLCSEVVTNGTKKLSQPEDNKIFVLEKQGKFGYSSRPRPTVDSRYVLVKVMVTGLCGSDVSRQRRVLAGDKLTKFLKDSLLDSWTHRQLYRREAYCAGT